MLGVVVEGGDAGEQLDDSVDGDAGERVAEGREGAEPTGFDEAGEGVEESKGGEVYPDSEEEEGEEEDDGEETEIKAELLNHPAANFWCGVGGGWGQPCLCACVFAVYCLLCKYPPPSSVSELLSALPSLPPSCWLVTLCPSWVRLRYNNPDIYGLGNSGYVEEEDAPAGASEKVSLLRRLRRRKTKAEEEQVPVMCYVQCVMCYVMFCVFCVVWYVLCDVLCVMVCVLCAWMALCSAAWGWGWGGLAPCSRPAWWTIVPVDDCARAAPFGHAPPLSPAKPCPLSPRVSLTNPSSSSSLPPGEHRQRRRLRTPS
jgi:hypothetical protein